MQIGRIESEGPQTEESEDWSWGNGGMEGTYLGAMKGGPNTQCYHCQQYGHIALNCPSKGGGKGKGGEEKGKGKGNGSYGPWNLKGSPPGLGGKG
eukprot:6892355-Karenia_brevis.AAC.1